LAVSRFQRRLKREAEKVTSTFNRWAPDKVDVTFSAFTGESGAAHGQHTGNAAVELGNFSVSLAVKDLIASRAFYEKLGFHVIAGGEQQHYLILQNQTATIGLFQGMFDKNVLTFNPGWNRNSETLPSFQDVRDLQQILQQRGLTLTTKADPSTTGPASFMLLDPDGNPILIDQHVPRPAK
jgi:catechol 2,3-dioxygenase-like lactoylglutathione lyase family enzyme